MLPRIFRYEPQWFHISFRTQARAQLRSGHGPGCILCILRTGLLGGSWSSAYATCNPTSGCPCVQAVLDDLEVLSVRPERGCVLHL